MLKVYYGFQNTPLANYIEKGPKTMSLQPHQHSNLSIDVHVASVLHDELLQDAPLKRKKNSTREQHNLWLGRFSLTRVQPDYLYLPQAASTREQEKRQTPTKPSVLWDWSSPDPPYGGEPFT